MKKIIYGLVIAVGVLVLLFYAFNNYIYQEKQDDGLAKDFKAVTFTISGEPITLEGGVAILPIAPGSASVRTIKYFGNELAHDIDGDRDLDMVFLVTENDGGSGTFFYLVGAVNMGEGYVGTQAMLIGDRIAPQTTEAGPGTQVLVNYMVRAPGEPMSAQPSVGKSLYAKFDPVAMDFGEVVQNFEGESDSKANLIVVDSPFFGSTVSSPITVTGKARGYWFFEASFPIEVVNWDGLIIGQGYATADGDWMTEDFAPFTGTIEYNLPADTPYRRGTIIFKKDNPSGLPEHDDAVEIPIEFAEAE